MIVHVKVRGHAREYFHDKRSEFDFEFSEGETVADMLGKLGINPLLVMRVIMGGVPVPKTASLQDGSEITLITPVAGG